MPDPDSSMVLYEGDVPIGPQPRPPNPIDIPPRVDTGTGPDEADKGAEWACSACTFVNKPGDSECEMCGSFK